MSWEWTNPEEDLPPRICKMICPFCSKPFTGEMLEAYNGTYGCDTGCEYLTVEVECNNCKKIVYSKT